MHSSYSLLLLVRAQQDQIARRAAAGPKPAAARHRGFRRRPLV